MVVSPVNTEKQKPERLLTVQDVAERTGFSSRSIWRLIDSKELPAVRIGQRGTRIKESALCEFLAALPAAR